MLDRVKALFNENLPDGAAEFTYIKAIAFRLLFLECAPTDERLTEFKQEYAQILGLVMDLYALPKEKIYEIKGFYRALFEL